MYKNGFIYFVKRNKHFFAALLLIQYTDINPYAFSHEVKQKQ